MFLKLRCVFSMFIRCLATLYDGAFMLLTTSLIGLSGLCKHVEHLMKKKKFNHGNLCILLVYIHSAERI